MLDSLDTLIAFALIFTVVSLLVTIIVQMITSAANLRGKNLAWAVAETFEAIEPSLVADVEGAGKRLADYVLKDPLLSDKQVGNSVKAATAVRPEELFDTLVRIATGKKTYEQIPEVQKIPAPAPDDSESPQAKKARQAIEKQNAAIEEKNKSIKAHNVAANVKNAELVEIRKHVLALFHGLGIEEADLTPAGLAAAADQKIEALRQGAQGVTDVAVRQELTKLLDQASRSEALLKAKSVELQQKLTAAYQKFEAWLDTGLERAQEWFRMHARYITFGVGIVFAAALQLDTVEIFKSVSQNKAMRDQLVAQASTVLGQGEKILALSGEVLVGAYQAWQKAELASESNATVKAAVQKLDLNIEDKDTRESVQRKVAEKLKFDGDSAASEAATAALKKLEAAFDQAVMDRLGAGAKDYNTMKRDLNGTGFALFPDGGWRWLTGDPTFMQGLGSILRHWYGIMASMLLLSLGAPFWFNLLKSLSSLRSTVADNIATEDKADTKQGPKLAAGSPPASVIPPAAAPAGP